MLLRTCPCGSESFCVGCRPAYSFSRGSARDFRSLFGGATESPIGPTCRDGQGLLGRVGDICERRFGAPHSQRRHCTGGFRSATISHTLPGIGMRRDEAAPVAQPFAGPRPPPSPPLEVREISSIAIPQSGPPLQVMRPSRLDPEEVAEGSRGLSEAKRSDTPGIRAGNSTHPGGVTLRSHRVSRLERFLSGSGRPDRRDRGA